MNKSMIRLFTQHPDLLKLGRVEVAYGQQWKTLNKAVKMKYVKDDFTSITNKGKYELKQALKEKGDSDG